MDNFTGFIEFIGGIVYNLISVVQIQSKALEIRQILVTLAVVIWSIRLSGFLAYRMFSLGPLDTRIDDLAKKHGRWSIIVFWLLPHAFWSTFCCFPLILLYAYPMDNLRWSFLDVLGFGFWSIGFLMETIADHLKLKAKLERRQEKYYHLGRLWNYSRNPNHCGEVFSWFGLSIVALNIFFFHPIHRHNVFIFLLSLLSPSFTLLAMVGEASLASEIRNNRRYRDDIDYVEYRKRTSLLWPMAPHFYVLVPKVMRKIFFFEWKIYDEGLKSKRS